MADPSVVDPGEARDPGVAGALNTLLKHLLREGKYGAIVVREFAALAVVETALADREKRAEGLGVLAARRRDEARAAEARAVAAEEALADALSESKSGIVTRLMQRAEAAEAELQEERAEADDRERVIRNERNMWFEKWEAAEAERDDAKLALDELHREAMASIEHVKAERDTYRAALEHIANDALFPIDHARAVLAGEEPT